jgi:hypothetical protein
VDAPFLALVWHPGRLRLVEPPPPGEAGAAVAERWRGDAPGAFGPGRRVLALWRAGETVVIRFPGDPRVPVLRSEDGGRTFAPVPPVPGGRSEHVAGCQAHWDGSVTVIEGSSLPDARTGPQVIHRLPAGATAWDSVELPGDVSAWSVSVLPSGDPLVGCARGAGGAARAALLRLAPSGIEVIEPRDHPPRWLRWLRESVGERAGEPFSRVDAAGEPWLLQQVQGPLEDDHAVIHLVTGDRWQTVRLWRDGAPVWLRPRPGAVRLVMSDGRLRDTEDGGRTWTRHDLMPAAGPLLPARRGWTVRVASAAQHGDDLLVVVAVEDADRPEAERLRATSVLHTADDGRTVRELLRTDGPEEAVVGVAPAPTDVRHPGAPQAP